MTERYNHLADLSPDPERRAGGVCSSCREPIWWGRTVKDGKLMPLDRWTGPEGNVLALRPRIMGGHVPLIVVTPLQAQRAWEAGASVYRSHFATCPNAEQHRRS